MSIESQLMAQLSDGLNQVDAETFMKALNILQQLYPACPRPTSLGTYPPQGRTLPSPEQVLLFTPSYFTPSTSPTPSSTTSRTPTPVAQCTPPPGHGIVAHSTLRQTQNRFNYATLNSAISSASQVHERGMPEPLGDNHSPFTSAGETAACRLAQREDEEYVKMLTLVENAYTAIKLVVQEYKSKSKLDIMSTIVWKARHDCDFQTLHHQSKEYWDAFTHVCTKLESGMMSAQTSHSVHHTSTSAPCISSPNPCSHTEGRRG